ncbi:MAG TPA: CPBP family glutamic-type intramembrane protease [Planctomycetota bacterium]|nr:CPBP family glutamic-type intramembrane protease [Planctomycetota bacterium]
MPRRLQSLRLAIRTLPSTQIWLRCAFIYLLFLLLAAPLGFSTGLLKIEWMKASPAMLALTAARIVAIPALFEELVFRALLLPHPSEHKSARHVVVVCTLALLVFVAIHPLNGIFVRTQSRAVFTDPIFLTIAALLGLACTIGYQISGSIWPPVAMHWGTVVVWTICLGGKRMLG